MFDHLHYLPILLARRAELAALAELPSATRSSITPCFVIPPRPWNHVDMAPAGTVHQHVERLPPLLAAALAAVDVPDPPRAFVDVGLLDDLAEMDDGTPALRWLIDESAALGLQLVPVTSPRRAAASHDQIAELQRRHGTGVCLRLVVGEWPSRWGPVALGRLMARLAVRPRQVDLILDLGDEVDEVSPAALGLRGLPSVGRREAASTVIYELATLPVAEQWRSVTVAGTLRPSTPDDGPRRPRAEWQLHLAVRATDLPRRPSYGDYVGASADPRLEVDLERATGTVQFIAGAASVVVAARDHHGPIGTQVMARTARAGLVHGNGGNWLASHCALERAIDEIAHGRSSALPHPVPAAHHDDPTDPLAAVTEIGRWRQLAAHHHLISVVEQLRDLARPDARRADDRDTATDDRATQAG